MESLSGKDRDGARLRARRAGKAAEAKTAAERAVAIAEKLAAKTRPTTTTWPAPWPSRPGSTVAKPGPAAAAVAALRKAVEYGFDNVYKLKNDEHLAPTPSPGRLPDAGSRRGEESGRSRGE